jgi:hypothetical protein
MLWNFALDGKRNGRLGIGYVDSIEVGHVTKERI